MKKFLLISVALLVVIGVPIGSIFVLKSVNTKILTQLQSNQYINILDSQINESFLSTQATFTLQPTQEAKDALKKLDEKATLLNENLTLSLILSNNPLAKDWLTGEVQVGESLAKNLDSKTLATLNVPMELSKMMKKNVTLSAKLSNVQNLPIAEKSSISLTDSTLTLEVVDAKPFQTSLTSAITLNDMKSMDNELLNLLPSKFNANLTLQENNLKSAGISTDELDLIVLKAKNLSYTLSMEKPLNLVEVKTTFDSQFAKTQDVSQAIVQTISALHQQDGNGYTAELSAGELTDSHTFSVKNLAISEMARFSGTRADTSSKIELGSLRFEESTDTYDNLGFELELGITNLLSFANLGEVIQLADNDEKVMKKLLQERFYLDKLNFTLLGDIKTKGGHFERLSLDSDNSFKDNSFVSTNNFKAGKVELISQETADSDSGYDLEDLLGSSEPSIQTLSNAHAEVSFSLNNLNSIINLILASQKDPVSFQKRLAVVLNNLFYLDNLKITAGGDFSQDDVKVSGISVESSNTFSKDNISFIINLDVGQISAEFAEDMDLDFGGASLGLELTNISKKMLGGFLQELVIYDNADVALSHFLSLPSSKLPILRIFDTYVAVNNEKLNLNGNIKPRDIIANRYGIELELSSTQDPTELIPFAGMIPQLQNLQSQIGGRYVIKLDGETPDRLRLNGQPLDF